MKTMKKIYIIPTLNIVKIEGATNMLAGSDLNLNSSEATEWGSRDGSLWDDED